MILRARVISTLDGCSKEDAQAILDNKKQNLQTYDTLVLEQPIDFSAFNKLTEEVTDESTQQLSLRKKVEQNHQKTQQPIHNYPETNHNLPETNHDFPESNYDLPPANYDLPETNHDFPTYDEFQPNIFLGETYLDNDFPPEFEIDESQFYTNPEQNYLTH